MKKILDFARSLLISPELLLALLSLFLFTVQPQGLERIGFVLRSHSLALAVYPFGAYVLLGGGFVKLLFPYESVEKALSLWGDRYLLFNRALSAAVWLVAAHIAAAIPFFYPITDIDTAIIYIGSYLILAVVLLSVGFAYLTLRAVCRSHD